MDFKTRDELMEMLLTLPADDRVEIANELLATVAAASRPDPDAWFEEEQIPWVIE